MDDLIKDKSGNIQTTPVTGWAIGPLAGIAVIAAIDYRQQTERGGIEDKKVQLTLLPQQALELADTLRRTAMRILEPSVGNPLQ